jgi:hypothetical protein
MNRKGRFLAPTRVQKVQHASVQADSFEVETGATDVNGPLADEESENAEPDTNLGAGTHDPKRWQAVTA